MRPLTEHDLLFATVLGLAVSFIATVAARALARRLLARRGAGGRLVGEHRPAFVLGILWAAELLTAIAVVPRASIIPIAFALFASANSVGRLRGRHLQARLARVSPRLDRPWLAVNIIYVSIAIPAWAVLVLGLHGVIWG